MLMADEYTETVFHCNTNMDIPPEFIIPQNMPMGHLDQLNVLRKRRGLTQAQLAEQLGVEQPTVQRWEKGKREPDLTQLMKIAFILGVEPAALIDPSIAVSIGPVFT